MVKYKVMKMIIRNRAREFKQTIWLIINYRRISQNQKKEINFLHDVAIMLALSKDQIKNLIICISSIEFSSEFPVISMRNKKIFIIQADEFSTIKHQDITIILVRYPNLYLLIRKINQLGWKSFTKKILHLIYCQKVTYRNFHEFYNLSLLNEIYNLDVYSTISVMGKFQKLFYYENKLRRYKTNIIYYAEPIAPVRHESGEIFFEYEDFKNNIGDFHWVWTSDYAHSLAKNNSNIIVKPVGSITFKMREKKTAKQKLNQIVIFDVSPQKHVKKITFYQMELISKFFEDIVVAKNGIEKTRDFELILKPKRTLGSNHLNSYLKLLKRLQKESELRVIDPDVNPYSLIAESTLIISIPFTSIALIGKEVNTNSIYYYPFFNKIYHPNPKLEVPLIYGVSNLREYMRDNV